MEISIENAARLKNPTVVRWQSKVGILIVCRQQPCSLAELSELLAQGHRSVWTAFGDFEIKKPQIQIIQPMELICSVNPSASAFK